MPTEAHNQLMIPWGTWLGYVLPACILLLLLPVVVARTGPFRKARERFRAIEQEFRSLVALFSPQSPGEPAR